MKEQTYEYTGYRDVYGNKIYSDSLVERYYIRWEGPYDIKKDVFGSYIIMLTDIHGIGLTNGPESSNSNRLTNIHVITKHAANEVYAKPFFEISSNAFLATWESPKETNINLDTSKPWEQAEDALKCAITALDAAEQALNEESQCLLSNLDNDIKAIQEIKKNIINGNELNESARTKLDIVEDLIFDVELDSALEEID